MIKDITSRFDHYNMMVYLYGNPGGHVHRNIS